MLINLSLTLPFISKMYKADAAMLQTKLYTYTIVLAEELEVGVPNIFFMAHVIFVLLERGRKSKKQTWTE